MASSSYTTLFKKIDNEQLSPVLVEKIIDRIDHAYVVRLRIRTGLYTVGTVIAVFVFIPIIQNILSAMEASGFSSYLSLIISDSSYLVSAWKQIGIVLVESLPLISIAVLCGLTLVFAYSLSKSMVYWKTLRHYSHS